jgi:transposase InsO family protein
MRYSQAEKQEIIHLVENSEQSVKQTLKELGIPRSTFYDWYKRYQHEGYEGLSNRSSQPRQTWNRIPEEVQDQVVDLALENPEKSPRELAWHMVDHEAYFISESSVYRILKRHDLITSPLFEIVTAGKEFEHKTTHVHEMWQTDFTQLKVVNWGWYYLCTILDDYSRYIIAWRLSTTMGASDIIQTLDIARERTGLVKPIRVKYRPRLLSDNGSAFISHDLRDYLKTYPIKHIRGTPYHPQTQGKIERWHRSMKNVIKLEHYYFPWELEQALTSFVDYYNQLRYHESIDNLTPADVYFGRAETVKARRKEIKQRTLRDRRQQHFHTMTFSV